MQRVLGADVALQLQSAGFQWCISISVKTLMRPVRGLISAVLTQKPDQGGLSRSWQRYTTSCLLSRFSWLCQSAAFVRWHFTPRRFGPSSRRWLCFFFYSRSSFSFRRTIELSPRAWNGFIHCFYASLSFSSLFMQMYKRKTRGQRSPWQSRTKTEISVACKTSPFTLAVCSQTPPFFLFLWNRTLGLSGSFHQTSHSQSTWMSSLEHTRPFIWQCVCVSIIKHRQAQVCALRCSLNTSIYCLNWTFCCSCLKFRHGCFKTDAQWVHFISLLLVQH